jgi:hypothetical protein
MKSPIEKLRDQAIKQLPKPTEAAVAVRLELTMAQTESLMDMFPYLHGSSHGYGQQGPVRRRLQDKGLIKSKDDGWIPTKLGYQVIAVILDEREKARIEDVEINNILTEVPRVVAHRDWDKLMRIVQKSEKPNQAIQLIKNLLPGVSYVKEATHPHGARFLLPESLNTSDFFMFLREKSKSGAHLGYAI